LNLANLNNVNIILGVDVVNYSITRFAISNLLLIGDSVTFLPDTGFTVLGLSVLDSTTNYVNGGMISVIRVDSTFILSAFA
jgi:hypothetical protein